MSWFSNLALAYDRVENMDMPGDSEAVLLPPNHTAKNTDLCVVLDGDGNFRRAEATPLKNVVIPCTERSFGRSGAAIVPHPLHEELSYLALNEDKRAMYLTQLKRWSHRHPKVAAVQRYISGGSICGHLQQAEIPVYEKGSEKLFVRFRVEMPGDMTPNLWEDRSVAVAWQTFCAEEAVGEPTLCYVTGSPDRPALMHPRGINASASGARLISCNDKTNYTFRGRFRQPEQANSIGVKASHKAHAMLKYLIATQGYRCDTQAVIAWVIDDASALPDPFADSFTLMQRAETPAEMTVEDTRYQLGFDIAKKLRGSLLSMGNAKALQNSRRRVAVMALDAATTGRMSVTFYQEMQQGEYIQRILNWHEACRWWTWREKREVLSAPSVNRIVAAVCGEAKGEGYAKIQKQMRERLLANILCGAPLAYGWVQAAVARVSNPFSYSGDSGWDSAKWAGAIGVTCALVRKYYMQKKEDIALELDKTNMDRDYLFGRLLAVADRLENHARYVQGVGDGTDKRPTNAVRYISAFAAKPLRSWKLIFEQLHPSIQRLNGAEGYQRQIDEIMSLFAPEDLNDRPLGGKYLLGYSLQRKAIYDKTICKGDQSDEA